jgi:hypothetical protein
MRRQSSQVSNSGSQPVDSESSSPGNNESNPSLTTPTSEQPTLSNILYGDQTQDQGGEVRFSVELTRLDRLEDTYSLDIRRLKGNLKSYKFLYDSLREYVDSDWLCFLVLCSRRLLTFAFRFQTRKPQQRQTLKEGLLGFSFSQNSPLLCVCVLCTYMLFEVPLSHPNMPYAHFHRISNNH